VVAFVDQAGEVILSGVMRYASHGDTDAFRDRPRGEDDIQLTRGDLGILIEGFVKVTQAEEHDRIRMLAFDIQVLASERG
jgi:hypothetical protein